MYTIQSDLLNITIDSKGAELKTVFHKVYELEYMWSGDPAYWGKTSPVLFPIVGTLKDNTYRIDDKAYTLSRHGFARDKEFTVKEHRSDMIHFSTESTPDTLAAYPFHFIFSIIYIVIEDRLMVKYQVENKGTTELWFSIGGHPAFKVPLADGSVYNDYRLIFEKEETAPRWPISKEGLIENGPLPLLVQTKVLPLSKELFARDALVFKHLQSGYVTLTSDVTPHGLRFFFTGFSYLGLWAAPGADFLCIEPWCGIADSVDSNQQFPQKEGIQQLPADKKFSVKWEVRFF